MKQDFLSLFDFNLDFFMITAFDQLPVTSQMVFLRLPDGFSAQPEMVPSINNDMYYVLAHAYYMYSKQFSKFNDNSSYY